MSLLRRCLSTLALVVLGACGAGDDPGDDIDAAPVDAQSVATTSLLWSGVYLPGGGYDTEGLVYGGSQSDHPFTDRAKARPAVLQTYRSFKGVAPSQSDPGAALRTELAQLWQNGITPHLYIEPDDRDLYPASLFPPAGTADTLLVERQNFWRTQLAKGTFEPYLDALAKALVKALTARPEGRLMISFGAEMNGNWTVWGCLSPGTFIALHRHAHDVVMAALDEAKIDRRRLRWVFAPDSRGAGARVDYATSDIGPDGKLRSGAKATRVETCTATPAAYYPGHAYSDYLGMSAYRSLTEEKAARINPASVDTSVAHTIEEPATELLDAVGKGLPASWREGRFLVLQTGALATDATRATWIATMFRRLDRDPRFAGVIYFNGQNAINDYSVVERGDAGVVAKSGLAELSSGLGKYRSQDGLTALFERHYADVGPRSAYWSEVQRVGDLGFSGCATDEPARFCPDQPMTRATAAVMLARLLELPAADPSFSDVPADHWARGAIGALEKKGIVHGCATGSFCPEVTLQRSALLALVAAVGGKATTCPAGPAAVSRDLGAACLVRATTR